MHFYCYCATSQASIPASLGQSDYSYYFVLKGYQPLLASLGSVEIISVLDDSLAPALKKRQQHEDCYVLAFAPPHKIPRDLTFPVIPVLAWEYMSLPHRDYINNSDGCWVSALAHFRHALCISTFARQVVEKDVGEGITIESVPTPCFDFGKPHRDHIESRSAIKAHSFGVSATVIDSRNFHFSADTLYPKDDVGVPLIAAVEAECDNGVLTIDMGKTDNPAITVGFHPPEGWGAWTRADNAWLALPYLLQGELSLTLQIKGFGNNVGASIEVVVGKESRTLELGNDLVEHTLHFLPTEPVNCICFKHVDHSVQAGDADTRRLGIGVAHIVVSCPGMHKGSDTRKTNTLALDGVVYTSIFNPRDGRKNWEDILTAFCFAFREQPGATLLLKMTCKSVTDYMDQLLDLLCQLHPFSCRVLIVHGYLTDEELFQLVEATSFITNASRGEGQCLPLVEFMSSGIPAIATDNTAMADYVTDACAFIVSSAPEPTFWPTESEQRLTTFWYRPTWESLRDAYLESYRVATDEPDTYRTMAREAVTRQERYCSIPVLTDRLVNFLSRVPRGGDAA